MVCGLNLMIINSLIVEMFLPTLTIKKQTEGELMFDAELDSICPGLSNYRISQYTDDECLDELKNFSK